MKRHYAIIVGLLALSLGLRDPLYADGWREATPSGVLPYPRYGHTMVKWGDKVYMFGGTDGNRVSNELYVYDLAKNVWRKEIPSNQAPPARHGHSALVYGGAMYIFYGEGKSSGSFLSDIWRYDFLSKEWTQVTSGGTETPSARSYHATALVGDIVVLYGGRSEDTASAAVLGQSEDPVKSIRKEIYGDTWKFNLKDRTWAKGGINPYNRYGHSSVAADNKVYVYGGVTPGGVSTDIWVYDTAYNYWTNVFPQSNIPGRAFHAAGYDEQNKNMWICGGTGGSSQQMLDPGQFERAMRSGTELGETWYFNLNAKTWTKKADGPSHMQAAGVLVPQGIGGAVNFFIFGGLAGGIPRNTTWQYYSSQEPPVIEPPQGSIVITNPIQGTLWCGGSVMPITWHTGGLGGNVRIGISPEGGVEGSFITIVESTSNDGAYDWVAEDLACNECVLRIESAGAEPAEQGFFSVSAPAVRILDGPVDCFMTIQDAYEAASNNDVIQIQEGYFPENLSLDRPIVVRLRGGFDGAYSSSRMGSGVRRVIISNGSAVFDNIYVVGSGAP